MDRRVQRVVRLAGSILSLAFCAGCDTDVLLHQTASFGGEIAGGRGTAQVLFINNTPYRAIFTFGAYDDFDQETEPELIPISPNDGVENLSSNGVTTIRTVTCARVFSIGGDTLLRLARENLDDELVVDEALVPGAYFSRADRGDENDALPTEGVAEPIDLWLGADFPCESLVVFRFEINDVGPQPFRIDFEVIPSRDDR